MRPIARDPVFPAAPDARFEPAPADGVAPEGFFSTSNFPTYVKLHGSWRMPADARMDGVIVLDADGGLFVRELRHVRKSDPIAMGLAEDGREGILVHDPFAKEAESEAFAFMSSDVSREKPMDYDGIVDELLRQRDEGGYVVWVVGPALVHSRGRQDMAWLIDNGFVQAFFGGNAVAVHDIEADLLGTTLGMSHAGQPVAGGHSAHMRAINKIRAVGSIRAAIDLGLLRGGIMHALETQGIPYVLGGSVRDDGPLPETMVDMGACQDAMRFHTRRATMLVMVATALHSIATGNMSPSFYVDKSGRLQPLTTVCVDSTEFTVSKLKDRGTHQAYGLVTNAQDFMRILVATIKDRLARRDPVSISPR